MLLSPLPPSSPPALSYIDEDEVEVSKKAQQLTPLPSSGRAHIPRTEHLAPDTHNDPPFEFELHHQSKIFATPRRQPQPAQGSADPFGFLALERKLKLERTRVRRQPLRPLLEPAPEPELGSEPEPERALDPSNYDDGAGMPIVPEPEVKSTITTLDSCLVTSTPISRHVTDITAPPAITPVHIRRRRRRRPTASAFASFLFPVDDDDGNPFLVRSSSSAYPTPSPSKDRRKRPHRYTDDCHDGDGDDIDDNDENDENRNPFLFPNANSMEMITGSVAAHGDRAAKDDTKDDASPVVSPIRRKRKRTRAPAEEEGDEKEENRSPKRKTKEERAPLAKKIKTRTGSNATKVKDDKEDENRNEGKGEGEGGKRRSARLAKRVPLRDDNNNKTSKSTRSRSELKGQGKENAIRKPASRSEQQQKPSKPSSTRAAFAKAKVKAKDEERDREGTDDVALKWEKERVERVAYFKTLDSYELETENIYVI